MNGVPTDPEVGVPTDPDLGVPPDPEVGVPTGPEVGVSTDPEIGVATDPEGVITDLVYPIHISWSRYSFNLGFQFRPKNNF